MYQIKNIKDWLWWLRVIEEDTKEKEQELKKIKTGMESAYSEINFLGD